MNEKEKKKKSRDLAVKLWIKIINLFSFARLAAYSLQMLKIDEIVEKLVAARISTNVRKSHHLVWFSSFWVKNLIVSVGFSRSPSSISCLGYVIVFACDYFWRFSTMWECENENSSSASARRQHRTFDVCRVKTNKRKCSILVINISNSFSNLKV